MSHDQARTLARQLAAQLRHLREFRGQAYVGAAALPGAWPEKHVETASDAAGGTWPSGQVRSDPGPDLASRDSTVTRVDSGPRRSATPQASSVARDPEVHPAGDVGPADPALQTWPSGQVPQARARPDHPAPTVQRAAPVMAERPASPVRLPTLPAEDPRPADGDVRDKARTWTAAEKLDYLRRKNLGNCQRCKLAATRTNIVFGVGNPEAELMFIGEAPGFDEDREGEPFVGAAGRRLTQWLGRLGLGRDQVYIANVLKCRPPGNRDPEADEVERCSPFLRAQIRAIAPKVIVALGRHAGMLMLSAHDKTLREMRGRGWTYQDPSGAHQAALFVTYHPSYVIRRERELSPGQRNPADDTVIADLQQALQKLQTMRTA